MPWDQLLVKSLSIFQLSRRPSWTASNLPLENTQLGTMAEVQNSWVTALLVKLVVGSQNYCVQFHDGQLTRINLPATTNILFSHCLRLSYRTGSFVYPRPVTTRLWIRISSISPRRCVPFSYPSSRGQPSIFFVLGNHFLIFFRTNWQFLVSLMQAVIVSAVHSLGHGTI